MNSFFVTDDLIASHNQRMLNFWIDKIFQFILIIGIFFVLTIIAFATENDGLLYWMRDMGFFLQYLMGAVIAIVYYGLSETLMGGRTLGKFFSGTIVVTEDGSIPDSDVILKRSLCRVIPLEILTFLGTPCRGWHDSIPDVYVVDKKLFDESLRRYRNNKALTAEINTEP